jgi:hypothetical protein
MGIACESTLMMGTWSSSVKRELSRRPGLSQKDKIGRPGGTSGLLPIGFLARKVENRYNRTDSFECDGFCRRRDWKESIEP